MCLRDGACAGRRSHGSDRRSSRHGRTRRRDHKEQEKTTTPRSTKHRAIIAHTTAPCTRRAGTATLSERTALAGTPDVVRKLGLHVAVKNAGLDQPGKPRLRFHYLRLTYASLLIAQGVNVAFASRQLGHASVSTTLNVHMHLFDHAEHAETVIERLEGRFGETLQPTRPELPTGPQVIEIGRRGPPTGGAKKT
jgi:hypothetical protein